jgi:3-hydroxymyristoyl/3-hydroxydecanoyl-(acyl carrier protein) dehydratase
LLDQGKRALNERLRARLLQGVERVALPRRFRYVAALPADAQGKSTEARLAALFRPTLPAVEWRSRDAASAVAVLDVSPDLLVFDGHFPDAPILPGVAQLDWAIRIAQSCFEPAGQLQRFARAEALKFQRPVLPGMRLDLSLQWRAADRVLGFAYRSEAGLHASGNVVFAPEDVDA